MKTDASKEPKKSTYIWATFVRNFTKNFQKSPNLVTLIPGLIINYCKTRLQNAHENAPSKRSSKTAGLNTAINIFATILSKFCVVCGPKNFR